MIKVTDLNGKVRYFTPQQFSEYKKIFREYNPATGYTPDYEPTDQEMMSSFGTKWHDGL